MTKLKTQTLGNDGMPSLIVCEGHVCSEVFNLAFRNEGWSSPSDKTDECLRHVYGKFIEGGQFVYGDKRYTEETTPYTIADWD